MIPVKRRVRCSQIMLHLTALALLVVLVGPSLAQDADSCDASQMQVGTYSSAILGADLPYTIYLPPCYSPSETAYPLLILLHGSNRSHEHWPSLGIADVLDRGIIGQALPPMIVAMPFGSWIANENRFEGQRTWSSILLTEFLPHIEQAYAVSSQADQRAIGGISRGGFWAFNIALRFPDQFAAVGGHSPFFDPGHFPAAYNPLDLASSGLANNGLRIWLDRGADDYAQFGIDLMAQALTESGTPHEYRVYPLGEHDDAYWAAHLDDYLRFYAASWQPVDAEPPLSVRHTWDTSRADLYLPAAALESLRFDISTADLVQIYAGRLDFDLVLGQSTFADLTARGVPLNPATRIVEDADVLPVLQAEYGRFTLLPFDILTLQTRPLWIDMQHPLDLDLSGYPFVFPATGAPTYEAEDVTRLLYSGVTALGRGTRTTLNDRGIPWATAAIRDTVSRPDVFHMSHEVSFAPRCPQSDEPVIGGLCAEDAHFSLFTDLDADLIELTGNHNLDYGPSAALRSLVMYHDASIATIGGGATLDQARQPHIITTQTGSIALLACNWNGPEYALATDSTPGAAYCDLNWLSDAIPALKAMHDTVIVSIQYAEYDQFQPIERQQYHFRQIADLGADAVIGTQAHTPQTLEIHRRPEGGTSFIHYGLGNLYFDQTAWRQVRFFMDELIVYRDRLLTVNLHTGVIEDLARPRWMTPAERNEFLSVLFFSP